MTVNKMKIENINFIYYTAVIAVTSCHWSAQYGLCWQYACNMKIEIFSDFGICFTLCQSKTRVVHSPILPLRWQWLLNADFNLFLVYF